MKFGIRKPSIKRRISARTSLKRMVRHRVGIKMPKGGGYITNPKKAIYNKVYRKTTVSIDKSVSRSTKNRGTKVVREPIEIEYPVFPHGFKSLKEMTSKAYKKHLSTKGVFLCERCKSDNWGILKMGKPPYNFESIFCQECGEVLFTNDDDTESFNSFIRATNIP